MYQDKIENPVQTVLFLLNGNFLQVLLNKFYYNSQHMI